MLKSRFLRDPNIYYRTKRIGISIYIMLYLLNFPVVIIPSAKLLIPFNRLLAP